MQFATAKVSVKALTMKNFFVLVMRASFVDVIIEKYFANLVQTPLGPPMPERVSNGSARFLGAQAAVEVHQKVRNAHTSWQRSQPISPILIAGLRRWPSNPVTNWALFASVRAFSRVRPKCLSWPG